MNYAKHHMDPTLILKSWPTRFLLKCLFQNIEAESLYTMTHIPRAPVWHLEWSPLFAGALTLNPQCSQEGIPFSGCSLLQPIPCRKTILWTQHISQCHSCSPKSAHPAKNVHFYRNRLHRFETLRFYAKSTSKEKTTTKTPKQKNNERQTNKKPTQRKKIPTNPKQLQERNTM